jgi:membrane protein required for colicin V production
MTLALGWVDIGLLAFLSISVLVGLLRGFVFELLSLAGWFAAWLAATQWAGWAERYLPAGEPGSALKHGVAFACVFLLVLVIWGLAARLVRSLIRATPLSPLDRVLGAAFGLLRGMLALLVLTAAVGFLPLVNSPAWQQSQGAVWLQTLLQGLRPWLSKEFSPYLSA